MSGFAASRRSWWRLAARLLLSAAVLGLVFFSIDADALRAGFERLDPATFLLGLGGFLGLQSLSALKWWWAARLTGAGLAPLRALSCHWLGLFANLCLPSLIGGDVLRLMSAAPGARSKAALVLASFCDRLADLFGLVVLPLVALALAPAAHSALGNAGTALGLALALMLLGVAGGALALRWQVRRKPLRRQPKAVLRLLRALLRLRARPLGALAAVLAGLVLQAGFVLLNVFLGERLGLELALWAWFLLWPLAKVAAMLPLGFGGIGVREAAFAGLLTPWGAAVAARGVSVSVVWQSMLLAGGLLAGGGHLLTRPRR